MELLVKINKKLEQRRAILNTIIQNVGIQTICWPDIEYRITRGRNSRKRKTFSMGDVEFQMEWFGCFRLDWTFCRIKVLIMAIYFQ